MGDNHTILLISKEENNGDAEQLRVALQRKYQNRIETRMQVAFQSRFVGLKRECSITLIR